MTCIFVGCFAVSFGYGLATGLRHKVTDIFLSRTGLRIHTNSDDVAFEVGGKNERIDSSTRKSIRKGTDRLSLLHSAPCETNVEVLLINLMARQALQNAAHENHHTRDLDSNGTEGYIAEKTDEILESMRAWKKKFPVLTDDLVEGYVCLWIKNALIPPLRKACFDKIDFYTSLLARNNVSESVKEKIKAWLSKNERYIQRIDELAECSAIKNPPSSPNHENKNDQHPFTDSQCPDLP